MGALITLLLIALVFCVACFLADHAPRLNAFLDRLFGSK